MAIREIVRNNVVLTALIIGLALRVFFAFAAPIGGQSNVGRLSSYNDEIAHANYVVYILQHNRLPTDIVAIQDCRQPEKASFENYQPPLYYLIVASFAKLLSLGNLRQVVYVGRLLNVAIFAGLIAVFISICRIIFANSNAVGGGIIFISLSGVFVRFGSTTSNDPLFWLLAAGMILTALEIRNKGITAETVSRMIIWGTLALYTKLSALILLPICYLSISSRLNLRDIGLVTVALLVAILLALPIWLRNLHYFGGIIPLSVGFGTPSPRLPNISTIIYAIRSFIFPWSEFWHGLTGAVFLIIPWLYLLVNLAFWSGWKSVVGQPVLLGAVVLVLVGYIWLNTRYNQAEGRYLFAAWPAIALMFSGKRSSRFGIWPLVAVMSCPYLLFFIPAGW